MTDRPRVATHATEAAAAQPSRRIAAPAVSFPQRASPRSTAMRRAAGSPVANATV
ncbi:hypothetical protein [Bordetella genomosp. 11]|uniref:hypothetical protein n=1 Tax=Bordetella genomosp. 11 TaxID=1416808 RepID=UPI0015960F53|nr:hypothetical protein [Bordetella genomosp. 11]